MLNKIRERKLAIRADIRFDREEEERLDRVFEIIAPTGDSKFLTRRDIFFSYDKERDVWCGSTTTTLPTESLKTVYETLLLQVYMPEPKEEAKIPDLADEEARGEITPDVPNCGS